MADPITRSGSNYSIPRDSNRIPFMLGASSADGTTPLPIEIDPSDGGMLVHISNNSNLPANINLSQVGGSSISLGQKTKINSLPVTIASDQTIVTQYTTGDIAAAPIGTAIMFQDSGGGNDMQTVSNAWPLPADISSGGGLPSGNNAIGSVSLKDQQVVSIGALQNAATANGDGTSTGSTQFDFATVILQVVSSPSMSGGTTVNFEASVDGSHWVPIEGHRMGTLGSLVTTTTTDGIFIFDYSALVGNLGGTTGIRARISNYSAGTITVNAYGSDFPSSSTAIELASAGTVGSAVPARAVYLGFSGISGNLTGWPGYSLGDGSSAVPIVGMRAYNGSTSDSLRTPTTFKTVTATSSGNNAVWTPTSGKKFRLMGYAIYAPDDVQAGSAGDIDVTFQDGSTPIGLGFTFWAPDNTSTSNRHNDSSGAVQLGNGYLSSAANNVLNMNLSAAITLGKIRVTVWGTEE